MDSVQILDIFREKIILKDYTQGAVLSITAQYELLKQKVNFSQSMTEVNTILKTAYKCNIYAQLSPGSFLIFLFGANAC